MRDKAIYKLYPNASYIIDGKDAYDIDNNKIDINDQLVDNEVAALVSQIPFNECKVKAKQLIADSDWAALSDVSLKNQTEYIAYRAALRALIINPVADPVWPTEPTPEWG